ncbi:DUF6931 family protein [Oceanospirillum sediminis]|uniref:DUF6931 family protein n=1 Tax=Oceanospirillum sediminis TaxID=2760088 RepID=UPI001C723EBC|nr:hypothetical protein [Oceanospirillum sediminis]
MIYKKIPYTDSQILLQQFELSEPELKKKLALLSPHEVIEYLAEQKLYIDLINFISHGLPVREGIWWACLAMDLRHDTWGADEQKALAECKRWVTEPDEHKRRTAEYFAEKLENTSAVRWLAQSVFWSGQGSIAPPGEPVTLPPDFLHAKASSGAINTAAVIPEWDGYEEYYQQVISSGLDLARGGSGQ